jgi:uncharacterized protein (TIGR00730 family)
LAGFTVANGAGSGLMEQSLQGAFEAGGETIGVGLNIENRQQSKYAKTLQIFENLQERQKQLISLADGIIALPGGMGTAYEILEIIALKRVGLLPKAIPFAILGEFYFSLNTVFKSMLEEGFLEESAFDYFSFFNEPKQAVEFCKKNLN